MKHSATCRRTGDMPKGYAGAARESRANAGISPGSFSVMTQQLSFGRYRFEPATAAAVGRPARGQAHAQSRVRAGAAGGARRPARDQAGAVRRGLEQHRRQRRRPDHLHPGAAQGARRRRQAAALYRDPASLRLLLRCRTDPRHPRVGRERPRTCSGGFGPARDRSAALHGHEPEPGPGLFLRRPRRRADRRVDPRRWPARRMSQLIVPVSRCGRGPARCGQAARRQLDRGGQRASRRRSAAHHRAAHRRRHRLSQVVAALRAHARRCICDPG